MKIGLFPMVGDLLHSGHLLAIKDAKQHCDYLIVAMNCDPTIDNPNKNKPIESVYERFIRFSSCKYVDTVIPYSGENDLEFLCKTTKYDVRFIGKDHADKGEWTGKEFEDSNSIEHYIVNRDHGKSSTELRKRIKEAK